MIACFVTGTDTGVGKTLVSSALLREMSRYHPRVIGMKPVAAGAVRCGTGWESEDAIRLRAASTAQVPSELDNPVLLPDPVSPHIAASRAGTSIAIDHLVTSFRELARRADAIVVEGAGGFHVPLTQDLTGADLACALDLPVVLTVGIRLGCLNHAALTAEAIAARGLKLAGWVANKIDPDVECAEENIEWLEHRLQAPLLGVVDYLREPNAQSVRLQLPFEWR